MHHEDPDDKEQPLDPAMEKIRRKMVRLQLVSSGILLVCFLAVIGAIVYKVAIRPAAAPAAPIAGGLSVPSDQPLAATAALPAGFEIRSVSMSGSQILFYGSQNGGQKLYVYDLAVGHVIADVTITSR